MGLGIGFGQESHDGVRQSFTIEILDKIRRHRAVRKDRVSIVCKGPGMKTQFFDRLSDGWFELSASFRAKADVKIGIEKVLGIQDQSSNAGIVSERPSTLGPTPGKILLMSAKEALYGEKNRCCAFRMWCL